MGQFIKNKRKRFAKKTQKPINFFIVNQIKEKNKLPIEYKPLESNFLENMPLTVKINYNPDDFYVGKKICLIGNGSSLEKYEINFNDYDYVIGMNQIYKTKYIENINVLYHAISFFDVDFLPKIKEYNEKKLLILIPKELDSQKRRVEKLLKEHKLFYNFKTPTAVLRRMRDNPLTGMVVLTELIESNPEKIDLFGIDFYEEKYLDGAIILVNNPLKDKKRHDLEKNKKYFFDLLNANKNITWYN